MLLARASAPYSDLREFIAHAKAHPGVVADHCYIDAYCLNLIRKPWDFDVCPMENQFGDKIGRAHV